MRGPTAQMLIHLLHRQLAFIDRLSFVSKGNLPSVSVSVRLCLVPLDPGCFILIRHIGFVLFWKRRLSVCLSVSGAVR
jgi:hypothetical protein